MEAACNAAVTEQVEYEVGEATLVTVAVSGSNNEVEAACNAAVTEQVEYEVGEAALVTDEGAKCEAMVKKQNARKKLQKKRKKKEKALNAQSSNMKGVQRPSETVDFRPALVLECRTSQVV